MGVTRFSDAELAAEWHKQDKHFDQKCEGYDVAHDGEPLGGEKYEKDKLRTVERFATLPHYDEPTQDVTEEATRYREAKGQLDMVAGTYEDAVQRGLPPIKAVIDGMGLPRGTAIRRIRQAREQGLLSEGTKPRYSLKIVAVANALGVTPEQLANAVIENAGGDLRVHWREHGHE